MEEVVCNDPGLDEALRPLQIELGVYKVDSVQMGNFVLVDGILQRTTIPGGRCCDTFLCISMSVTNIHGMVHHSHGIVPMRPV